MKSTLTILFYVNRSRINEDGLCIIRCRITYNETSSSFSTQLQTSPDERLTRKGCIRAAAGNSNGINLRLNSIEKCLHSLYERTLEEENYIMAEYLRERYIQQSRPVPTLTELYQSVCEYKEGLQGEALNKAIVRAFKDSYKSFVHLLQVRDRTDCMSTEVDRTLLEDYRLFMPRDLGNKENNVGNRLRHLHQVIRKALQERYVREDPLELIDIETPTCKRNALTADDLRKLSVYRPHRSTDNHCRLIFLLGCFTGLAFSGLKRLRMDDVYTFRDGRRYISFCRAKTQSRNVVPLLPIAEKILAIVNHGRRGGLFFREFPSNNNFNKTIQEVCIKAELLLHTQTTSHAVRHTFATTICLENGLPIEAVSKILGHHFVSTTEIYARVTKSKIAKEMQPLMGNEHTRIPRKALRLCPSRIPKKSNPMIGM